MVSLSVGVSGPTFDKKGRLKMQDQSNAGPENAGPNYRAGKSRTGKVTDQIAVSENALHGK